MAQEPTSGSSTGTEPGIYLNARLIEPTEAERDMTVLAFYQSVVRRCNLRDTHLKVNGEQMGYDTTTGQHTPALVNSPISDAAVRRIDIVPYGHGAH